MASPAQVPNQPSSPWSRESAPAAYYPPVALPPQQYEQYPPAAPQATAAFNQYPPAPSAPYERVDTNENNNRKRNLLLGGAVVAVAAIGVSVAAYFGAKAGNQERETPLSGSEMNNSATLYPGADGERRADLTIDNATPDEFYNDEYFTDDARVQWANEQLQAPSTDPEYPGMTVEQAAYQRLQAKLASQGRPTLGPLVAPSLENTANEANNLQLVAQAAAFYINDASKGEKILAASADNESDIIDTMRHGVVDRYSLTESERLDTSFEVNFSPNDAAKSQAAGHSIEMASPYSTSEAIGDIEPVDGLPTRVAYLRDSRDTDHKTEEVQTFVGGRWVAMESITPSDVDKWIPPTDLVDILEK